MNSEELKEMQLASFKESLDWIYFCYSDLVDKRYNGKLDREDYLLYDMMDMMLPLKALLSERNKPIHPDYALEKLNKMKAYLECTISYYNNRKDDSNE